MPNSKSGYWSGPPSSNGQIKTSKHLPIVYRMTYVLLYDTSMVLQKLMFSNIDNPSESDKNYFEKINAASTRMSKND